MNSPIPQFWTPLLLAAGMTTALLTQAAQADDPPTAQPLRALLVTGGCCHDYEAQKTILSEGISARTPIVWTIVHEGGQSTDHRVSLFENPDWAKGYDVVVHNECFADVHDPDFIERITAAHHAGTPAVVIHCTMHTFRTLKSDQWREFLGASSFRHGVQHPLAVQNLQPDHPIMKDVPEVWKTGNEELYVIAKLWPNTTPLAQAPAQESGENQPVIWTHTFGHGRVFGTTLAHNNSTMKDPVYLDMLTRGLLWACGRLDSPETSESPSGTPDHD